MNALDTNVLVYAVSALDGSKEKAAKKILARATHAGWSVPAQVYGEFFAVMTRRQCMTRKEARAAIPRTIHCRRTDIAVFHYRSSCAGP